MNHIARGPGTVSYALTALAISALVALPILMVQENALGARPGALHLGVYLAAALALTLALVLPRARLRWERVLVAATVLLVVTYAAVGAAAVTTDGQADTGALLVGLLLGGMVGGLLAIACLVFVFTSLSLRGLDETARALDIQRQMRRK